MTRSSTEREKPRAVTSPGRGELPRNRLLYKKRAVGMLVSLIRLHGGKFAFLYIYQNSRISVHLKILHEHVCL